MADTSIIWLIILSYGWYFSHTTDTWIIWLILQSYDWYLNHMADTSVIWLILESYGWYFSHMTDTWIIWLILQSYECRLPHYTLPRKLVCINNFRSNLKQFYHLGFCTFKCLFLKHYLWLCFVWVPEFYIWWLNLIKFLLSVNINPWEWLFKGLNMSALT